MITTSTKLNPRAQHPPSYPPTVLHTCGTTPNTSLHPMGRRCQKEAWKKPLE